jgi:hypothetical protein
MRAGPRRLKPAPLKAQFAKNYCRFNRSMQHPITF